LVIPASALAYDTPMAQSAKAAMALSGVPGLKSKRVWGLKAFG